MRWSRFWNSFRVSLALLVPLFGTLSFLVNFGVGMMAFGPQTRPKGFSAVLAFLASLPVPVDSPVWWAVNGICWGVACSFLAAYAVERIADRPKKEARGFPVSSEPNGNVPRVPPPSGGLDWEKEKRSEDEEPEEKERGEET